jgi:hypothetical protein
MRDSWSRSVADDAELGKFWHAHRRRHALPRNWLAAVIGVTALVIIVLCFLHAWLAILIVAVLAAAGLAGYVYWPSGAELSFTARERPSRVAVYDRGLVLRDAERRLPVVRWEQVTGVRPMTMTSIPRENGIGVTYQRPGEEPAEVQFGHLTGRGALVASINQRTPAAVRWRPRVITAAAVIAAVGLYLWLVVLPARGPSPLPGTPAGVAVEVAVPLSALSLACNPPGTAYTAAPAYAGPGPHPVAVFVNGNDMSIVMPDTGSEWMPNNLATTQLLVCIQASQGAKSHVECDYSGFTLSGGVLGEQDFVIDTVYRFAIYVLRTHREVGSATIIGGDFSCPKFKQPGEKITSSVTNAQLQKVLDPYVNRAR